MGSELKRGKDAYILLGSRGSSFPFASSAVEDNAEILMRRVFCSRSGASRNSDRPRTYDRSASGASWGARTIMNRTEYLETEGGQRAERRKRFVQRQYFT